MPHARSILALAATCACFLLPARLNAIEPMTVRIRPSPINPAGVPSTIQVAVQGDTASTTGLRVELAGPPGVSFPDGASAAVGSSTGAGEQRFSGHEVSASTELAITELIHSPGAVVLDAEDPVQQVSTLTTRVALKRTGFLAGRQQDANAGALHGSYLVLSSTISDMSGRELRHLVARADLFLTDAELNALGNGIEHRFVERELAVVFDGRDDDGNELSPGLFSHKVVVQRYDLVTTPSGNVTERLVAADEMFASIAVERSGWQGTTIQVLVEENGIYLVEAHILDAAGTLRGLDSAWLIVADDIQRVLDWQGTMELLDGYRLWELVGAVQAGETVNPLMLDPYLTHDDLAPLRMYDARTGEVLPGHSIGHPCSEILTTGGTVLPLPEVLTIPDGAVTVTSGSIAGRVCVNFLGGEASKPAHKVVVTLYSVDVTRRARLVAATETNENGAFVFSGVPPNCVGDYPCQAIGFEYVVRIFTGGDSQIVHLNRFPVGGLALADIFQILGPGNVDIPLLMAKREYALNIDNDLSPDGNKIIVRPNQQFLFDDSIRIDPVGMDRGLLTRGELRLLGDSAASAQSRLLTWMFADALRMHQRQIQAKLLFAGEDIMYARDTQWGAIMPQTIFGLLDPKLQAAVLLAFPYGALSSAYIARLAELLGFHEITWGGDVFSLLVDDIPPDGFYLPLLPFAWPPEYPDFNQMFGWDLGGLRIREDVRGFVEVREDSLMRPSNVSRGNYVMIHETAHGVHDRVSQNFPASLYIYILKQCFRHGTDRVMTTTDLPLVGSVPRDECAYVEGLGAFLGDWTHLKIEEQLLTTFEAFRLSDFARNNTILPCRDIRPGTVPRFSCVNYDEPLLDSFELWQFNTTVYDIDDQGGGNAVEGRVPQAEGNFAAALTDLWDEDDDTGGTEDGVVLDAVDRIPVHDRLVCSPDIQGPSPVCFFGDRNQGHALSIGDLLNPISGQTLYGPDEHLDLILAVLWQSKRSLVDYNLAVEVLNYNSFFRPFRTATPARSADGSGLTAGHRSATSSCVGYTAEQISGGAFGAYVAATVGDGLQLHIEDPNWLSWRDSLPPYWQIVGTGSRLVGFPAFATSNPEFINYTSLPEPLRSPVYSGAVALYAAQGDPIGSLVDRSNSSIGFGRAMAFGYYNDDRYIDLLVTTESDRGEGPEGLRRKDLITIWLGRPLYIADNDVGFPRTPPPLALCRPADAFFYDRPVLISTGREVDQHTGHGLDCAFNVGDANGDGFEDFVVCDHREWFGDMPGGEFGGERDRMLFIAGRPDAEINLSARMYPDAVLTHGPRRPNEPSASTERRRHVAIGADVSGSSANEILIGSPSKLIDVLPPSADHPQVAVFMGGRAALQRRYPADDDIEVTVLADCELRVDGETEFPYACHRNGPSLNHRSWTFGNGLAVLPEGSFDHEYREQLWELTPHLENSITSKVVVVSSIVPGTFTGFRVTGARTDLADTFFEEIFNVDGGRYQRQFHSDNLWGNAFLDQFAGRAPDIGELIFHESSLSSYGSALLPAGDVDGDTRSNDLVVLSGNRSAYVHIDLRANGQILDRQGDLNHVSQDVFDRSTVTYPIPFASDITGPDPGSAALVAPGAASNDTCFVAAGAGRVDLYRVYRQDAP